MQNLAIGYNVNNSGVYSSYAYTTNYVAAASGPAVQIIEDRDAKGNPATDGTGSGIAIAPGIVLSAGHVLSKVSTSNPWMISYSDPKQKFNGDFVDGDISVGNYSTTGDTIVPIAVFVGVGTAQLTTPFSNATSKVKISRYTDYGYPGLYTVPDADLTLVSAASNNYDSVYSISAQGLSSITLQTQTQQRLDFSNLTIDNNGNWQETNQPGAAGGSGGPLIITYQDQSYVTGDFSWANATGSVGAKTPSDGGTSGGAYITAADYTVITQYEANNISGSNGNPTYQKKAYWDDPTQHPTNLLVGDDEGDTVTTTYLSEYVILGDGNNTISGGSGNKQIDAGSGDNNTLDYGSLYSVGIALSIGGTQTTLVDGTQGQISIGKSDLTSTGQDSQDLQYGTDLLAGVQTITVNGTYVDLASQSTFAQSALSQAVSVNVDTTGFATDQNAILDLSQFSSSETINFGTSPTASMTASAGSSDVDPAGAADQSVCTVNGTAWTFNNFDGVLTSAAGGSTINVGSGCNLVVAQGSGNIINIDGGTSSDNFTVVWGDSGNNIYNFNTSGSSTPNVLLLNMSGVTADNVSNLDLTKLQAYVNETYNLNSITPAVIILNPSNNDIIENNGIALTSPSIKQTSENIITDYNPALVTTQSVLSDEGADFTYVNLEGPSVPPLAQPAFAVYPDNPLKIDPNPASANPVLASIDNAWIQSIDDYQYFGFESASSLYNFEQLNTNTTSSYGTPSSSSVTIPVLNISSITNPMADLESTYEQPYSNVAAFVENQSYGVQTSGGFNLLNFQSGEFGITLASNFPTYTDTVSQVANEVTAWTSAISYNLPGYSYNGTDYYSGENVDYVGDFAGTQPASLGPVIESYSNGPSAFDGPSSTLPTAQPGPTLNIADYLLAPTNNPPGSDGGDGNDLDGQGETVALTNAGDSATASSSNDTISLNGDTETATVTSAGTMDTVNATGGSDSITFNGTSGSVSLYGAGDTLNMAGASNAITLYGNNESVTASGASDTIDVAGTSSDGQAVQLQTTGATINVNGSNGTVNSGGTDNTINLQASDNGVVESGSSNAISITSSSTWETLYGSGSSVNDTAGSSWITLFGNESVTSSEASDTINVSGTSSDGQSVQLQTYEATVNVNGSNATVSSGGTDNTINLQASNNGVVEFGTSNAIVVTAQYTWETLYGAGTSINDTAGSSWITLFGNESVTSSEASDTINVSGTSSNGQSVQLQTYEATVNVNGLNATVSSGGTDNTINLQASDNGVVEFGTSNAIAVTAQYTWETLYGAGTSINDTAGSSWITLFGNESVTSSEASDTINVSGTSSNGQSVQLQTYEATVNVNGSNATVSSGGTDNTINMQASNNGVVEFGTSNAIAVTAEYTWENLIGAGTSLTDTAGYSSISLFGNNESVTAAGNSDTITVSGQSDTINASGSGDTFVYNAGFGSGTVSGFSSAAADTISFASSEFANFAAVLSGASNSGGNVVLTGANGDTLTLAGISKSALASSEFRFHS